MTIVADLIGAAFVAAAIQSVWRLLKATPGGEASFLTTREADGVHLVMNAAMALMLTPAYDGRAAGLLVGVFVAAAAVLVASLLWRRSASEEGLSRQSRIVGVGYHALMLAAMIYAVLLMPPDGSMPAGGMAGMRMAPRPWISLPRVLGAIFALDAVVGATAVAAFPRVIIAGAHRARGGLSAASPAMVRELRVSLLPHLVMDAGMAWMLVSA